MVKTGNAGFSEANNIGFKYAKDKMGATTVSSSKDDCLRIRNKMRNITDAAEVYLKFIG